MVSQDEVYGGLAWGECPMLGTILTGVTGVTTPAPKYFWPKQLWGDYFFFSLAKLSLGVMTPVTPHIFSYKIKVLLRKQGHIADSTVTPP